MDAVHGASDVLRTDNSAVKVEERACVVSGALFYFYRAVVL